MEKLGHDVVERVDLPLLNIWPLLSRLVLRPWLLILLGVLARMLRLSLPMLPPRLGLLLHVWR
jgi:hypothetical protein